MIAVLGGLGAALAFSGTTLCYARLPRLIGAYTALSWVMLVGLAITLPLLALAGTPDDLGGENLAWLALAGLGNVGGIVLTYNALGMGKVSIVAPIVSTEGAIAAVISVAAGEHLRAVSAAVLAIVAAGILLASLGQGAPGGDAAGHGSTTTAGGIAVLAALAFGTSLYAVGRVGQELPVAWAVLPARAVGVALVAVPLAAASRLSLPRPAAPYVVAGGALEVVGFVAFTLGSRHGLAVSAVLASQFGALAAVAGYVLFRERLTRLQVAGVAAIAVGVAVLSALQA